MIPQNEITRTASMTSRARILITDSHRLYADGLRAMLMIRKKLGNPVIAETGLEAMELLMKNEFDLLISDIQLYDDSGFDLIFEARKHFPELKILAISMHGYMELSNYFRHHKPDAYLVKTSNPDDFFQTVNKLLGFDEGL
jgi:two-component system, NarL family, nitrate/nitrite response regulator NarL